MKKFLLSVLFAMVGGWVFAQSQLSDTQSQELIKQLTQTAASMQTMQCRFVQEKAMAMLAEPSIAEGTMLFAAPDKMRWEYTKPYASALIVNGDHIIKVTEGKAEILDAQSNRMYQGMISLIMGSASGKKLFDTSAFDVALYDDNGFWRAEMTPKRREMKRMFSQLVFLFDKQTRGIRRVEFVEAGGDVTSIRFEEIKIDEAIEDRLFWE